MKNEKYNSDSVQSCREAYEAYVKDRLNKLETKLNTDAMQFNVNSFIDCLEDMKPNDYIFNKPQIEQKFGELILNANKKEWDFVLFSRVLESIYGIMKWREYQLHHIAFDDAYLSNYKIADPDCALDRYRFAATYCGTLDDLKAKADSMIHSVIEFYLPMFDDVEDDEDEGELSDELPELRSDNNKHKM